MKSTLSKLYNGEINIFSYLYPKMEEHRALCRRNYNAYDDFSDKLGDIQPELKRRFIEIMDQQLCEIPFDCEESFMEGFRLGARLMIEIYQVEFCD